MCALPSWALALVFCSQRRGKRRHEFWSNPGLLDRFLRNTKIASLQLRLKRDGDILFYGVSPARLTETERLKPEEVNDGH